MIYFTVEADVENASFALALNDICLSKGENRAVFRGDLPGDSAVRPGANFLDFWFLPDRDRMADNSNPAQSTGALSIVRNTVAESGMVERQILGRLDAPLLIPENGWLGRLRFEVDQADVRIRLWNEVERVGALSRSDVLGMIEVLDKFTELVVSRNFTALGEAGRFRIEERARAKGISEKEMEEVYFTQLEELLGTAAVAKVPRNLENLFFVVGAEGRIWEPFSAGSRGEHWLEFDIGSRRMPVPIGLGRRFGEWRIVR